jgi:hypothetical protein
LEQLKKPSVDLSNKNSFKELKSEIGKYIEQTNNVKKILPQPLKYQIDEATGQVSVNFDLLSLIVDEKQLLGKGGISYVYALKNNDCYVVKKDIDQTFGEEEQKDCKKEAKVMNLLASSEYGPFREYYENLSVTQTVSGNVTRYQILKRLGVDLQEVMKLVEREFNARSPKKYDAQKNSPQASTAIANWLHACFTFMTNVFSQVLEQYLVFRKLGINYNDLKLDNLMFTRDVLVDLRQQYGMNFINDLNVFLVKKHEVVVIDQNLSHVAENEKFQIQTPYLSGTARFVSQVYFQ